MRHVLLVAGSPRLPVDAVRHISVHATGGTAVAMWRQLQAASVPCDLLFSVDAQPQLEDPAMTRYTTRGELEAAIQGWLSAHPDGCVVLSAAINDYDVAVVERHAAGSVQCLPPGAKLASRADEVVIRLRPASKVIDKLRSDWGHTGPLVAFKYEAKETVLDSARSLQMRTGAEIVVANSLDRSLQAMISAEGEWQGEDRAALVDELSRRTIALAAN